MIQGVTSSPTNRYEWTAILLTALGFGLVGLDRWIIAPLFPAMMQDLHLDYADLGNAVGVIGMTWGVSSVVMGSVSDRFGRRSVLLPSIILFSLMAGLTGTASGIGAVLLIRAVMGATEGAYLASGVAIVADASPSSRRGLNQGIMLSAFPLFGLALAPIIATQLLALMPGWRWVFLLVAMPGLVLAFLMWRVLRDPPASVRQEAERVPWLTVLRSRNVPLAMLCIVCAMSGIFVLASMIPNYLQDYLRLSSREMGLVMSGLGIGGFAGEWLVCAASDRLGRRTMTLVSFIGALISVLALQRTGATPGILFMELLLASFFSFGVLGLMTGPVPTEAVPLPLIASAIGLVSGTGEIIGGGLLPVIAGHVARRYGIQNIFAVSYAGLALGMLVCLCLLETAPRRRAERQVRSITAN